MFSMVSKVTLKFENYDRKESIVSKFLFHCYISESKTRLLFRKINKTSHQSDKLYNISIGSSFHTIDNNSINKRHFFTLKTCEVCNSLNSFVPHSNPRDEIAKSTIIMIYDMRRSTRLLRIKNYLFFRLSLSKQ